MPSRPRDLHFLSMAARLAVRGHGGAAPNPMVGCVIVNDADEVVGWGYHRRCGDRHAEVVALDRAGPRARDATAYVTLEPCNHTGRTGPCTHALIEAGVARVAVARRDPNPVATGGLDRLRSAGIAVEVVDGCPAAVRVSDPFAWRVRSGLPWVVAKWAQTLDGRIATRSGESKWISGERSRRLVHRERGRVDAVMTGIGTVLADDPLLTARDVRRRRVARRIVVDPKLQTPLEARLVRTAAETPTTIACRESFLRARPPRVDELERAGVELVPIPADDTESLALSPVLRDLTRRHDLTTILVESGAGLLGRLFAERLVRETWVFVAPLVLGDSEAMAAVRGMTTPRLADGARLELLDQRRRDDDAVLRYRVAGSTDRTRPGRGGS